MKAEQWVALDDTDHRCERKSMKGIEEEDMAAKHSSNQLKADG